MPLISVRTLLITVGAIALLLLTACTSPVPPKGEIVQVQKIVYGNQLEYLSPSSQKPIRERVELIGLATPWKGQDPWHEESRKALENFFKNDRTVLLESDVQLSRTQDDNRVLRLAYVWKDRLLLNEEMLKQGWGLTSSFAPNTKYEQRLTQAQEKARLLGLGIWNPTQPMRVTPKEFRQANSSDS